MDDRYEELREDARRALEAETVYRGVHGRRRLSELFREGVALREVVPRLVHLLVRPHSERADRAEQRNKVQAAEKRVLSRKVNQRADVVVWDDLTLAEVFDIVALRQSGVTEARVATLFEVAPGRVRTIMEAHRGKHAEGVVYSAELRRRRAHNLQPVAPHEELPVRRGRVALSNPEDGVPETSGGDVVTPLRLVDR